MTEDVRITDAGPIRTLELNRPGSKNSLTLDVNRRLIDALTDAATNASVRCVVLRGAGGSFCSGLDLRILSDLQHDRSQLEQNLRTLFHGLIRALRDLPKPVVAFVDGPAVGFGCDLALACDLRIATERARFGEIFVQRGLMPDGGGTYVLPRLVGLGKAMELLLTGDLVEPGEALRLGLVNRVVPSAELDARGAELAEKLAAAPPLVVARVKDAVYKSLNGTFDEALEREVTGQLALLASKDFAEGLDAFFAKRPPRFRGE